MERIVDSTVMLIENSVSSTTAAATTSSAKTSYASSPSSSPLSSSIFTNFPLISAVLAYALAQSFKFLNSWYKERRWDFKKLVGSGGMPSSHSATVTALAIGVGLQEGFGGSVFATALILACVVMYDATGVRLHAGRQAEMNILFPRVDHCENFLATPHLRLL